MVPKDISPEIKQIREGGIQIVDGVKSMVEGTIGRLLAASKAGEFAVTGSVDPKTFGSREVSLEDGGKSRFLPALAIAIANASSNPDVDVMHTFLEFRIALIEKERPIHRSDKPGSTPNTIERLRESNLEVLDTVDIVECSLPSDDSKSRLRDSYVPTSNDGSVLLMPFGRNMFESSKNLEPDVAALPVYGVAFGANFPINKGSGKSQNDQQSVVDPVDTVYNVAFSTALDNGENYYPFGMLTIQDVFMRDKIQGYPNVAYKISPKAGA